jgi:hypothetical protein
MDQPNALSHDSPSHEECARVAREHWEQETDPKRKEFLGKIAQMWAELAAVKKLEKEIEDRTPAQGNCETTHDARLVG